MTDKHLAIYTQNSQRFYSPPRNKSAGVEYTGHGPTVVIQAECPLKSTNSLLTWNTGNFVPVSANYVPSAFSLLHSPELYFNPLLVLVTYPWWNWLIMELLRAKEKCENMASLALEPVVTFQKCHWRLLQSCGAFFWCLSPAAGKKAEGWHKLSVLLCD